MPLRGIKPTTVEKRLKVFFFGDPGSRKTTTALMFPRCYLIDTERGAENKQYVQALEAGGGAYFATGSLDDVLAEVRSLLTEKHEYRTLFIDPISVPYSNACDDEAQRLAAEKGSGDGTEFGRHKAAADRKMKRLCSMLLKLDMNVGLTAHSRTKWINEAGTFKEAGKTFDGYSKLEYLFDLVIETQLRGTEGWGVVRKSRIETIKIGEAFELSYDAIADRYGRAVLERGAEPVRLATDEQVARLASLVLNVRLSDKEENADVVQKWLDKADAETMAELPYDVAEKCIAFAESRVSPTAATAA